MAWVEIMPSYESLFREWRDAKSFLDWTGVLVNWHRGRRVEEVSLTKSNPSLASTSGSQQCFFLKKEIAVTWRVRFRNAWHGFGWCATSVREAAVLIAAKQAGVACPDVAAFGEHQRQAFVLLRGEMDCVELREWLARSSSMVERRDLAQRLGRELARLHDAGFAHPDLFAKHVLISEVGTDRVCFLDWARARKRLAVSWRTRLRDLAVLDATLHASLAGDRLRLRCLRAYLNATIKDSIPLRRVALQIRSSAEKLRRQRNLREIGQPATPPHDLQFVPRCDGKLLIVRSQWERLGDKNIEALARMCEPDAQARDDVESLACASGSEHLTIHHWKSSSSTLELPSLAHTLFRLARFNVAAPRLLAVGTSSTKVFAVTQCHPTTPWGEAFAKASPNQRHKLLTQAGQIVRQIHEAGYQLPPGESWSRRLGVARATGAFVFAKVEPLVRTHASWQQIAPLEFSRQTLRLTRTEQLRFLRGYLGADALPSTLQLFVPMTERQRAA
jgi:tRNA A-37 threonylcarbamoyl transferase component Bud32